MIKKQFKYCCIGLIFFFSSCISSRRVEKYTPAKPDYSQAYYWSALPFMKDSADALVPNSGLKDNQSTARADVFFVHPTNYVRGKKWNADLSDTASRNRTDRLAAKYEASVFNSSCRVYIPRYRTAKFISYFISKKRKQEVFDIAYGDIKEAFLYYLEHYNNGRPFIIASHSQGTDHAIRLCQEFFDSDSELNKRLVVAFLPGGLIYKNTFKNLKLCRDSLQCNCYVTWNSVPNTEFTFLGKPVNKVICVNPLTWTETRDWVGKEFNKGSLPITFDKIEKDVADAKISPNGLLWVHRLGKSKHEYPEINTRSYHILDYLLFYMNIRENAEQRVNSYFKAKVGP